MTLGLPDKLPRLSRFRKFRFCCRTVCARAMAEYFAWVVVGSG